MSDSEIASFMKKWQLKPTEAAFTLGVSLATLQNGLGGKRLAEHTYARMLARKAAFEAGRAGQNTTAQQGPKVA